MVPRLPPSVLGSTPGAGDVGYSTRSPAVTGGTEDDDDAGSRFGFIEPRVGESNSASDGTREPSGGEGRRQEGGWGGLDDSWASARSRRSSYGSADSRLPPGGSTERSDREDQQQQRASPLALNNHAVAITGAATTPTSASKHHPHHHHPFQPLKTPAGLGTPSRVLSERSSLDGFHSPSSGAAAAAAVALGGGAGGGGSSGRHNASSPPPGGVTSGRSSLGSAGARARATGRGSPSINSPRSVSPVRRGAGGDGVAVGGGAGGGGISPKKQARRSTDSQTMGRKSVDSQGGVSHNFKVRQWHVLFEIWKRGGYSNRGDQSG